MIIFNFLCFSEAQICLINHQIRQCTNLMNLLTRIVCLLHHYISQVADANEGCLIYQFPTVYDLATPTYHNPEYPPQNTPP